MLEKNATILGGYTQPRCQANLKGYQCSLFAGHFRGEQGQHRNFDDPNNWLYWHDDFGPAGLDPMNEKQYGEWAEKLKP